MTSEIDISTQNSHLPIPALELGLYVHVPFCATKCNFCAFVQSKPTRPLIRQYLEGIRSEWAVVEPEIDRPFSTIFWGGGTPGLLLPEDLQRLGEICLDKMDPATLQEWTVEMAPATVTPAKLEVLKSLGVTRISMGVQTFNDETLRIMDRFHSVSQIYRAWDWIQSAGFKSCNVDMIIAYPGQTALELRDDMEKAIALGPDHISTYCLTFEEDTPLYARLMQGVYKIDREAEADLYRETWLFLESKGFLQYEISNFARPGYASVHNSNTWRMQEWIGIGPSASSQLGNRRWTNHHEFTRWLEGYEKEQPQFHDETQLTPEILLVDSMLFGLRMNEGIDFTELETHFYPLNIQRWNALFQRLVSEGLATISGSKLSLTLEGRLLADAIAVEILALAD